jgi:hypothetical protein
VWYVSKHQSTHLEEFRFHRSQHFQDEVIQKGG